MHLGSWILSGFTSKTSAFGVAFSHSIKYEMTERTDSQGIHAERFVDPGASLTKNNAIFSAKFRENMNHNMIYVLMVAPSHEITVFAQRHDLESTVKSAAANDGVSVTKLKPPRKNVFHVEVRAHLRGKTMLYDMLG